MIFVTGGTGLLGAHLLYELTKGADSIRALYRTQRKIDQVKALFDYYDPSNGAAQFQKIHWIKGSILQIPELTEAMKGVTKVYHCAALVSFNPKEFNQVMKLNREGTANIVNVCLVENIEKLCYVSSTAAIGGENDEIITERTKWINTPTTSGYSISKYSAEKEVWRGIEEGLNAVIVNPCVILGAGNWNDSSLKIFRTVKNGSLFYPPGSNATVDARDVAEIMIRLMNSDIRNERFLCVGSNQAFRILLLEIANQLDVKAPKWPVNRALVDFARRFFSFASFLMGVKPAMTRETVNSLFSHRAYDNSKVKNTLNFEFRELDEMISNAIKGRIY